MNYGKSIHRSIPNIPLGTGAERTYFAGLKKSASDMIPDNLPSLRRINSDNLAGDIVSFVTDNLSLTLGGAALLGSGLYMFGHKNKTMPTINSAEKYTDVINSSMRTIATAIIGMGVLKRLSQEPAETIALRYNLKALQKAQKKPRLKPKEKPLVTPIPIAKTENKTSSMAKLFEN